MEALICPQCGGQITNYSPGQTFATCGYCSTRFLIAPPTPAVAPTPTYAAQDVPEFESLPEIASPRLTSGIATVMIVGFGILVFFVFASIKNQNKSGKPLYGGTAKPSPAAPSNPILLEFGGKGDGNGQFKDANSIAVDKYGRIYVSDDKLRVQRFDVSGHFINSIQIPANGPNYENARSINKIAVADNQELYVAVGGVVLVYGENPSKPLRTIQVAPDYIQDFALRSDGSSVMVSSSGKIETLLYVSKGGKIERGKVGFHTKAANAAMSPAETGVAAIRIAVDQGGNIYSVYALGALGSYSLSYNAEDFKILGFTPAGQYVYKFGQSMNSCGIAIDKLGGIYVSDMDSIQILDDKGKALSSITGIGRSTSFALDKDNNIYILADDKVTKRAAVR